MISNIFYLVKHLESDLVKFYERLCHIAKLKSCFPIFKFMISQSSAHERRVEKLIQNFQEKPFSEEPILKIHNHVKNVLFDRVTKEKDPKEIVELIANAEEIIGMTYQKIAVELRNKAKQYEDMAKALETLEQEEYIHRDIVLGKKKIQEMK